MKTSQPSGRSVTSYVYDADGRRVKKTVGATNTWFIYDASGQLAAEYGGTAPPEIGTHYLTTDHLGSTRLVTRQTNTVVSRHDYLPFGEEIPVNYGGRTTAMGYQTNPALTQRFTGKERDTETGLDYFGARYLSSVQGRWSSPDAPFADQQTEDPQSWNLYGYVRNRPLQYVDPTGRQLQPVTQRLVEIANRYAPQLEKFSRFVQRNAVQIGTAAAKIGIEVVSGEAAARVNASILMKEHPGLSEVNARDAVSAPFGSTAVVGGQGKEGADIKLVSNSEFGSEVLLQTEVKVSNLNKFQSNLSTAARQLGKQGGIAMIQLPNGTTSADVQQRLNGFVRTPGRDLSNYRRVVVEVRDADGNLLHQGAIVE